MGFLTNKWARYWDRTYQQIKDSVLTRLGGTVPEITDHTENNPYVVQVDIFAGIHEQTGYYVDNAGRESHLDSCRLYKSGVSAARLLDYKIIGNLAYSVNVVFRLNTTNTTGSDITIPAGTIVSNGTIPYVTQQSAIIPDGSILSNEVGALQYTVVSAVVLGVSSGIPNMLIVFTDKILHDSIVFYVNNIAWAGVDTMAYSKPTDEVYVQTVDKAGNVNIFTGDGSLYGKIPGTGLTMKADYKTTLASAGFVDAGELTTIVSTLTLPMGYTASVTNNQRSSGGSEVENLASLKEHIPMSVRTLNRAVTLPDYETVLEMCPGVARAGASFSCGKNVNGYIVPDGGGIASSVLVGVCQTFINRRKMVTTNVVVTSAGEVHMAFVINVTAANNYLNATVETNVRNSLLAWMGLTNQKISGTVFISDIYQAIEDSAGVVNSVITLFVAIPYATPSDTTVHTLNWTRAINNTSVSTIHWHIVFTDATHFQIIRNGVLMSSGNLVGTLYTVLEISFTVTAGTYTVGDDFEFVTYPYNPRDLIELDEPSLPVSLTGDLTINVTGGL